MEKLWMWEPLNGGTSDGRDLSVRGSFWTEGNPLTEGPPDGEHLNGGTSGGRGLSARGSFWTEWNPLTERPLDRETSGRGNL